MSETAQQTAGKLGEDAAAAYYKSQGYTVVARNVHISHNEIDLIVEDEYGIAFVEVKARRQIYGVRTPYGRPAIAVNAAKRARTVQAVTEYLRRHPTTKQPRIDVVEVYLAKRFDGTLTVTKVVPFRNAFGANG